MWKNEIKRKTKPSHVTFRLTTGSIVRFIPQTCNDIVSLKYVFTVLASVSKRKFLVNSILIFGSAWMFGYGANPIFFNIKRSIRSITSNFWFTPLPPISSSYAFIYFYQTLLCIFTKLSFFKKLPLSRAVSATPIFWYLGIINTIQPYY